MEQDRELREETRCVGCGEPVGLRERSFSVTGEGVLCWSCALGRGGQYDQEVDDWIVAPETEDLRRSWLQE